MEWLSLYLLGSVAMVASPLVSLNRLVWGVEAWKIDFDVLANTVSCLGRRYSMKCMVMLRSVIEGSASMTCGTEKIYPTRL